MFIRQKRNKSGVISIQVIDKSSGKYRVLKTVGSSSDPLEIESLLLKARDQLTKLTGQGAFNFDISREKELIDLFFNGIQEIRLVGPELVLGKLFDTIGFNQVPDTLFRHLVIARLCYPVSKLKTADYLFKYQGETIDVERIYRYLDKLYNKQKELVQQISYDHTLKVLDHEIRVVFYDVTTLYFEIEDQDDLRKTGFSKEGRHQNPQILLGLLVSPGGYPLAYEIFEGNQYEYILGARIKNEKEVMKQKILNLTLRNGQCEEIIRDKHTRLIISYSDARAKKDATNRKRGLEKLERAIASGKLSKKNINNRGYNKYLKLEGDIKA